VAISIAVVCEAPADQRTGCDLADRVFCLEIDWIEEEILVHLRQWRGLRSNEQCLLWKDVPRLASPRGYYLAGHFDGERGELDARAMRRALYVLKASEHPPDAVILLRDDDRKTRRRKGMQQAIAESKLEAPVVIGLAHPKRECWVLAGFEPQNDREVQLLRSLKNTLGFDPVTRAERLTRKEPEETRSAKRVLDALTGGDWDRQAECWQRTDLGTLQKRGQATGLALYLDEIREKIVPLLRRDPRAD